MLSLLEEQLFLVHLRMSVAFLQPLHADLKK